MIQQLDNSHMKIVMEYLKKNSLRVAFFYGNIMEYGITYDSTKRRSAYYYGYFENNILKGIIGFYNLGSCICDYETVSAREEFLELMKEHKFNIFLGMKNMIEPLYKSLEIHKKPQNIKENLYMINKNFHPYDKNNLEIVEGITEENINFLILAGEEGFGEKNDKIEAEKVLRERNSEEYYLFGKINNEIVSSACVQVNTDSISQIGGVFTKPSMRSKGYSKEIVSEICSRIIKNNKIPTLFVDKTNIPAIKVYNSLGFEEYDDYMIIEY